MNSSKEAGGSRRIIDLAWEVGSTAAPDIPPEHYVAATVPGAVQLDWARAEGWPPYWQGDNFRNYGWMEDKYWIYRTELPRVSLPDSALLFLVCGGVDYQCLVRLDGVIVHSHEGMFTSFELDLSAQAQAGSVLEIIVFPAPKRSPQPADRSQASTSVKPAVSYGWDWHPRLIPLGIWQETHLEIRPAARLSDAELHFTLNEDLLCAELRANFMVSVQAIGQTVRWKLIAPDDAVVLSDEFSVLAEIHTRPAELHHPQLWWPHDHGTQPLYRFETKLIDRAGHVLDERSQRLGFRRVRLVMHDGAWEHPAKFPKSRSHPAITVEINGRRIFAKGSNFVNPEIFPGICNAGTYRPLVELARAAHFNLLRCWGGAPVPKEAFFDHCDELGLMVWQEFPLACNLYPDAPEYLAVLDRESQSIVRRVRRHPSLALWCGGNELFNAWSGMTDQALPVRLLNRNCYNLDPLTPFLPTAPVDGMGHGDYRFRDESGREVFQIFAAAAHTAYSEFGCPSPSPVEYLRTFIPAAEMWPPRAGTAWESHHGLKAGDVDPTTWLSLNTLLHYFGESTSLEELVARGAWLQCAGLQCIFEEARRQKPRCSMAMNWCYNEPWPTAANNSIVNWPAKPKSAYAAVASSCRPILASARLPKFSWNFGETFRAELWLLNDRHEPLPAGRMTATLRLGPGVIAAMNWDFPAAPPAANISGPKFEAIVSALSNGDAFELELKVEEHVDWNSTYRLHFRNLPQARIKPPALTMPHAI